MKNKSLPSHVSIKIPLSFLKHRWFLYGAIAVIVLAGGTYWALGTPQYSMWQLKQAALHQDADKAMRFINIDKLMDNIWPKFKSAMMAEATKQEDPFGMIGVMLGSGLIDGMQPTLKEELTKGIKNSISGKSDTEGGETQDSFISSKEDIKKIRLETSQGKVYVVIPAEVAEEDSDLKFIVTRAEDGRYWQITDMEADWSNLFDSKQP